MHNYSGMAKRAEVMLSLLPQGTIRFQNFVMLILVPDRRSGTNSCKIASANLNSMQYMSFIYTTCPTVVFIHTLLFLSFCYAPKRPSPFSYIYPTKTLF